MLEWKSHSGCTRKLWNLWHISHLQSKHCIFQLRGILIVRHCYSVNSLLFRLSIECLEARSYNEIRRWTPSFGSLLENIIPQFPNLHRLEINAHEVDLFKPGSYLKPEDVETPSKIEHLGLMSAFLSPEGLHIMLHHLPNLKSICFRSFLQLGGTYFHVRDLETPVWSILKHERVRLLEITTDTRLGNQLISYLDSYSGLQHFILEIMRNQSSQFDAEGLLTIIAKKHARSLVKLGIRIRRNHWNREWTWQQT